MKFRYFIGIDQTGASTNDGKSARPLPCAVFDVKKERLHLFDRDQKPLWLSGFSRVPLQNLFERIGIDPADVTSRTTAYFVDCVFGLSEETWPQNLPPGLPGQWALFRRAAAGDRFGLRPAAEFFARILIEAGVPPYPIRRCERIVNANSVFRTHPFQKNIQCGTYRIWRDLGADPKPWINIRYLTPSAVAKLERPWLFEAYPSFLWREVLKLRTRDLKLLPQALKLIFPKLNLSGEERALLSKDPNFADAAVLALGGHKLQCRAVLLPSQSSNMKWRAKEGWIVGVPEVATLIQQP